MAAFTTFNGVTAASAVDEASEWFSSIDRSVFGSLVDDVDIENLILRHAFMYLSVEENTYTYSPYQHVLDNLRSRWDLQSYNIPYEILDKINGELCFWWSVSDDPMLVANSTIDDEFGMGVRWIEIYKAVAAVPARLPYFEAGIFDMMAMDRYIEFGIDSALISALDNEIQSAEIML